MLTEREILARIEGLSAERLTICVHQSWVRPRLAETGPVYDETDLARLRLIVELTDDMAVNDEAVPVILRLIDEVTGLRRRIRAMDTALGAEGPEMREAVIARLRAALGAF